jgi:ribosomal protein S18 acetylase RimI-like enzyme
MPLVEVYRYRRTLDRLPDVPRWPAGYAIVPFAPAQHAPVIHRMLEEGYRSGGGSVADLANWWSALSTDAEYDPDLVSLIGERSGAPVAAAICWSSAYVKDIVVAAAARRQGLASNLLRHILHAFHTRGARAVDLKVDAANHAAIALYRSLGWHASRRCTSSGDGRDLAR